MFKTLSKSLLTLYIHDLTKEVKDTLFSLPTFQKKKKITELFLEKDPNADLSWQASIHTY